MITASTIIQTELGQFKVNYHKLGKSLCVSFSYGDLTKNTPIVRIHSACLFAEAFMATSCDCKHQLIQSMKAIIKAGTGAIVYSYAEGRGLGLENKIKSMEIERIKKCDPVESYRKLGFDKSDYRAYNTEVSALKELKLSKKIILFSGNPKKRKTLEHAGFNIVSVLETNNDGLSKKAVAGKKAKTEKMGYSYKNI